MHQESGERIEESATSDEQETSDEPQVKGSVEKVLADADVIEILNEAAEELRRRYPSMFKPSSRCRPPHVNIDVLRDDMYQAEFIQRNAARIRSAADCVEFLTSINKELGAAIAAQYNDPKQTADLQKATLNAMKKAILFEFYLGLNKSWMYK